MKSAFSIAVVGSVALLATGCGGPSAPQKKIEPSYNRQTGKLELLRYDSDGDGRFDTFSYMDGTRIVRIEIDKDEDGKIDRWEYYGPGQKLEQVGLSRQQDGIEDAWVFSDANGQVDHIDISTKRDRKVDRVEHYKAGKLVSAEEDSDGDGTFDKWETYEGERLATVAFDTLHQGKPDRRLVYNTDGSAHLEVDPPAAKSPK